MKNTYHVRLITTIFATGAFCAVNCDRLKADESKFRRLDAKEYVSKIKAGWIGQMAGVGWGGPTEFGHVGLIMLADKMSN